MPVRDMAYLARKIPQWLVVDLTVLCVLVFVMATTDKGNSKYQRTAETSTTPSAFNLTTGGKLTSATGVDSAIETDFIGIDGHQNDTVMLSCHSPPL